MTSEQKVIAANAAYIEELIRDVDRLEKSRDYVTNELNRECNKMVAAEKELKEANLENLDLEFELEDTRKQLKAAKESSEGLTQDLIQSEKGIADLREDIEWMAKECDRLTNSNKALKLALELKQLNGPDVAELRKEIRQLRDQNDELTRMCAPDPDIPPVHVKTAEEIAEWCDSVACAVCNHMRIDDEGNYECDLEINGYEPCDWDADDMAAINYLIKFATQPEPTTLDVIVTDDEADE